MLVGGHGQQVQTVDQVLQKRLTAGDKITARVLGPTRHGLSVLIGQDSFQLTMAPKLTDTKTLTLQAVGTSPVENGDVRIIAQDDHALAKPIVAKLIAPSTSPPSVVSAIVQKAQLEVTVAPVNAEGKVTGSSLSVRLQTATFGVNTETDLAGLASARTTGETQSEPPRLGPNRGSEQVKALAQTPSQASAGGSAEALLKGSESYSNRATEQSASPMQTLSQPPADRIAGLPSEGPGSFPGRAIDQAGPQAPMSTKAAVDAGARADQANLPPTEGPSAGETESSGRTPASLVASAASLLSGIKKTIVGRHDGAKVSQPGTATHSSTLANENQSAQSAKPPNVMATSSLPTDAIQERAPSSGPPSPTPASGGLKTGPDRGLATMAVVVAREPAQRLVLEAKGQLFRVEQPLDLPVGTTLQAVFSPGQASMAPPIHGSAPETRATLLNQLITILDAIDQAGRFETTSGDPEPTRQLPMPDRHLASRFLSLLHVDDGTAKGAELSSSGRPSIPAVTLQDQIQGLLRDLRGVSTEPLADGWKSMTLPLGHDQAQAVMFYVRDQVLDPEDHGASQEAEPDEIQRAVFDVSFSQLGRCQIDVLCQDKRFDLLMRSDDVLSSRDQQTISALFRSACDIAGVTGEINFKVGDFFEPARVPAPSRDVMT
jgi:hypothetical protein